MPQRMFTLQMCLNYANFNKVCFLEVLLMVMVAPIWSGYMSLHSHDTSITMVVLQYITVSMSVVGNLKNGVFHW